MGLVALPQTQVTIKGPTTRSAKHQTRNTDFCDKLAKPIDEPTIDTQTRDCATVQVYPSAIEQPTMIPDKFR